MVKCTGPILKNNEDDLLQIELNKILGKDKCNVCSDTIEDEDGYYHCG